MSPVVILGCGPAGLFAAQAIKEMGGEPIIHSKKKKSVIFGPQFLTKPIPGLTNEHPDGHVQSMRFGTKQLYAERVYGQSATPSVWADEMSWREPAWDLREAYHLAWNQFESGIVDVQLDANDVEDMTAYFPLVISTIPQWAICNGGHIFESVPTLLKHELLPGFAAEMEMPADNFVLYNGTPVRGWFRTSCIFGMKSTETTASERDHPMFASGAEAGYKIVGNNCDCHPNLVRAGRMGTWRRGVQTADAYEAAVGAYAERMAV